MIMDTDRMNLVRNKKISFLDIKSTIVEKKNRRIATISYVSFNVTIFYS